MHMWLYPSMSVIMIDVAFRIAVRTVLPSLLRLTISHLGFFRCAGLAN